jgi:outer membrane lipoprotein SlyB
MSTAPHGINNRAQSASKLFRITLIAAGKFIVPCWGKALLLLLPNFDVSIPITFGGTMKRTLTMVAVVFTLTTIAGCAGGDLSTREKGAGIGALGGAAAGGIIGAAVGHPGAGAAIGGALGLGSGALVGDQLQGQQNRQTDQQRQTDANQAEIERQRKELEELRRQREY